MLGKIIGANISILGALSNTTRVVLACLFRNIQGERRIMGSENLNFDNTLLEYCTPVDNDGSPSSGSGSEQLPKTPPSEFNDVAELKKIEAVYKELLKADPEHRAAVREIASSLNTDTRSSDILTDAELDEILFTPINFDLDK